MEIGPLEISWPWDPGLISWLGLFHQSRDPHQNHRANKRDDDRAKNASAWPNAEHPKHPAADDAAEDAEDDVNHHAVSAAPHHFSGERSEEHTSELQSL